MNFEFTINAWEDFEYWMETDIDTVNKIKDLLKEIRKTTKSAAQGQSFMIMKQRKH